MVGEGPEPSSKAARRRQDVHALCPGCGVTRHRSLVLIGQQVVRVECRACGGRHRFQRTAPLADGSGAVTATGTPVGDFDFERYARYFTGQQACDDGERDVLAPEALRRGRLDYTAASVREVDRYCALLATDREEVQRGDRPTDALLTRTVLWGGAYLGEVIRRNASAALHWIDHEDYATLDPQLPPVLGRRHAFLCLPHGLVIDPLASVIRCVLDVHGPGLHTHVRATLHELATRG